MFAIEDVAEKLMASYHGDRQLVLAHAGTVQRLAVACPLEDVASAFRELVYSMPEVLAFAVSRRGSCAHAALRAVVLACVAGRVPAAHQVTVLVLWRG